MKQVVAFALRWTGALTALVLLSALGPGCARRGEIAEQTTAAQVADATAEAEIRLIPAELLTWKEVGRFPTGFTTARGVACLADGRLLVAGDRAVRSFFPDGAVEAELPVDGKAGPVAVGADGSIIVGLVDHVVAITTEARVTQTWEPYGDRTLVTSLAPSATELYIADAGNRTVWRYGLDGTFLSEIARGDPTRNLPTLIVPSPHLDIALRPDDTLLVVNPGRRSIQTHSLPDGALLGAWGRSSNALEGFGGCCNPTDIALLPDGRIVTAEKGIPRVKVYTAEGVLQSVVAPPDSFRGAPEGIDLAVNASGQVVLLDPITGEIRFYQEMAPPRPVVAEPAPAASSKSDVQPDAAHRSGQLSVEPEEETP